ncbi:MULTISPECIES: ATP-binding protein [Bacteroides]|jgi:predicted AAA+ superfamily ATPase|uniref:ATP-binding protein n=1 Tax=Bacteroides TaxID=816 RepID=UPI000E49E62E|nr:MULTISPECIES: ATP-binding protein [Bacteroides]RHL07389.1 ATP-binding protein [Bacteroides sp. AF39-11AC]
MRKDVIKSLFAIKQSEIPFDVIERDTKLPIDRKKIITIPGVRRCGKSTLMEIAINTLVEKGVPKEYILWLGFDDERLRSMTSEELDDVIASYMEMYPNIPIKDVYMFFDEIQLIKDWEYFILRVYKTYCKNIYVCGSNATMLSTELSSALRGYPLEYETYPLSFNEYCRFRGISTNSYLEQDRAKLRIAFEEYNQESAFPEIVLTTSQSERLKLLHGYFDTMLLKDLVEHYKISNVSVVRYFVKRIMANLTKPTSINAIYKDIKSQGLKVGKDDLYLWANYICDIFMFVRISKYDRSLIKEQKSLDKYYCIDNGIRGAVLLPQSNDNGKNLENTVFMQLNRTKLPSDKISYYQSNGECDFVLQRNDAVVQLIQVTWDMSDENTREREIGGILEASTATGCTNLLIITKDEETVIVRESKQISVVPAWKWLLQNKSI